MKEEISAAVNFLTCLVRKSTEVTSEQADLFQSSLDSILTEKFEGHWFPDKPCKGQAFRCIRVNSSVPCDSSLDKAAKMCGVPYENLKLPLELTIWVDPQEVCCRFGERDGSFFTIASFKDKENLSNNIKFENIPLSSVSSETPPESSTNKKTRRKPAEKPKKPASNKIIPPNFTVKGYPPKAPFMNVKNFASHPLNFVDWNSAMIPFPRIPHPMYPDLQFLRRPRKVVRPGYSNDRYHWPRK